LENQAARAEKIAGHKLRSMEKLMLLVCIWWPAFLFSQVADSSKLKTIPIFSSEQSDARSNLKPEILTSGFLDVINNGQVNASARLIRVFIGEPGKLVIPLSIYSGVSSNNFQNQQFPGGSRSNEQLLNNFINPLGGLANVSMEGCVYLDRKRYRVTGAALLYHAGLRILTGYRTGFINVPNSGQPINFLNSYGSGGFYFQTGAWERNNSKNVGICWIAGRYIICKSGKEQLQNLFPTTATNGFYHGWSAGWGIEINNLVNMKLIYYKYNKKPEIDSSDSIYQFSFYYSLR